MSVEKFDFIIIGGGIAGASAGAWLSEHGSVVLLEREDQPGYHSTGRSAATYEPFYGNEMVCRLIRSAGPFLENPPEGFCDGPILSPRGMMTLFTEGQDDLLAKDIAIFEAQNAEYEVLDGKGAQAHISILDPTYVHKAIYGDHAQDIDVDKLFQSYLRLMKSRGGVVRTSAEVTALTHNDTWTIETKVGTFNAPVVVNAAGAWCDVIAEMAGVDPIGLEPRRRSAVFLTMPDDVDISTWPMTGGADPVFYFKPDAGKLMVSPENADPSPPCDAWPEDMELAIGLDRFETATNVPIKRPEHSWAGLRSFVKDEMLVAGFDPDHEGFFWLTGQGGYGIETSPSMGAITGALASGNPFPAHVEGFNLTEADLSPKRLKG